MGKWARRQSLSATTSHSSAGRSLLVSSGTGATGRRDRWHHPLIRHHSRRRSPYTRGHYPAGQPSSHPGAPLPPCHMQTYMEKWRTEWTSSPGASRLGTFDPAPPGTRILKLYQSPSCPSSNLFTQLSAGHTGLNAFLSRIHVSPLAVVSEMLNLGNCHSTSSTAADTPRNAISFFYVCAGPPPFATP
jgi:hypothetical protein